MTSFYKNFIKDSHDLLSKNYEKLDVAVVSYDTNNYSVSISPKAAYQFHDEREGKLNEFVKVLNDCFIDNNPMKLSTHLSDLPFAKKWIKVALKLSPSNAEFFKVYNHFFSNVRINDFLVALTKKDKDYAKEILKLKVSSIGSPSMSSEFEEILDDITNFDFSKNELNELLPFILANYSHAILIGGSKYPPLRVQQQLFSFIRNNLGDDFLKEYVHYLPFKAHLLCPKIEEKKDNLWIDEDKSKLCLKIDCNYISQQYLSLVDSKDVRELLTQIEKTFMTQDKSLNLLSCEFKSNLKVGDVCSLTLTSKDESILDESKIKFYIRDFIKLYAQEKETNELPSDDFCTKTLSYIMLNESVKTNKKEFKGIKI